MSVATMIRAAALALLALTSIASAPRANITLTGAGGAAPTGCAQATTFLARTSGLDTAHQNAYTAMICRMVTDGIIDGDLSASKCGTKLDLLYVFATADTTTALLNICSTSFTAVTNGTPAFTADQGYLGVDGSTSVLINTGFDPNGVGKNFVLNSASLGLFSLTNVAGKTDIAMGGHTAASGAYSIIYPKYIDGNSYPSLNDNGTEVGVAITDTRGFYLASRTGSTTEVLYKNGVSVFTSSVVSTSMPAASIFILNANYDGVGAAGWPGTISMASVGAGLSSTDAANMNTAVCLYAANIGATWVGC